MNMEGDLFLEQLTKLLIRQSASPVYLEHEHNSKAEDDFNNFSNVKNHGYSGTGINKQLFEKPLSQKP